MFILNIRFAWAKQINIRIEDMKSRKYGVATKTNTHLVCISILWIVIFFIAKCDMNT